MDDDPFSAIVGFVIIGGLVLGSIFFVAYAAIYVIPAGLVAMGALYYRNNVYLPEKKRTETRARMERLYDRAARIAPADGQLTNALTNAGIYSGQLHSVAKELFKQEGLVPPPLPPVSDDVIAAGRYQDTLQRFMDASRPNHFNEFKDQLVWALEPYEPDDTEDGMFAAERKLSKDEIERLILRFVNDDGVFKPLIDTLNANFNAEDDVYPSKSKHEDYAWRYLKNTPLLPLADQRFRVSLTDRVYHTYLLGSSGSGKTNLIENVIAHDIMSDEDCCVVVIDSQTQLCEKLARLDVPDTTYITPKFDLALNLFDVGYHDMKRRGVEGETLINKTVGLLSFVMEGMMGGEFTNPQRTIFQYAIQLVISIPGGNIFTFMEILSDDGHQEYAEQIAEFDGNTRRFFTQDFGSDEYKRSREAIRRRLDSLMLNPTFRRLFSAKENRIDMLEQLASQRLILIDTNKPMLDDVASAFFGRLFIAMILRASHMRFDGGRYMRPVYLVVDEAHEYFDRSISDMLEQARKANIGLIVAHQSISQAKSRGSDNISDPLMVNTGTKIVWTSYRDDASKFAGSMQISADEILRLPQFTFGMYSRKQGFTPIRGVPNAFDAIPKRSDAYELQAEMEERYGNRLEEEEPPVEPTDDAPPPRPSTADTAPPGASPEPEAYVNGKAKEKAAPPPPEPDMI